MFTYTLLLLYAGLLAAVAQKRSFESARLQIEAIHKKYIESLKAHDKYAALELLHPDARVMDNERPTLIGRDAIAQAMSIIDIIGDVKIQQEELGPDVPNPNFLYERYRIIIRNLEGDVIKDQRRLVIWKATDDGYHPYIVMCNVDHKNSAFDYGRKTA